MKKPITAVLITGFVIAWTVAGTPVQAAKRTWTVIAGGGTKDLAVVSDAFHPRTVEIAAGDTVTWPIQGFHNVAFLSGGPLPALEVREGDLTYFNPQVLFPAGSPTYDGTGYRNSGVPLDPSKPFSYSLTFTKPGTYRYLCIIHGPGMGGTVIVKDRVTGSPAAVARQGLREQAASIKAGQTALANWKAQQQDNTVIAPMIGDLKSGYSTLRFSPKPLVVNLGATVTWVMRDPFEIHTVTFTSGEQKVPDFVIPVPQPQGPPKFLLNPKAAVPTKTRTYDGTGYVNSGILFPPGIPGNPPTSFTLTFLKTGTYEYWCLVHAAEGMKGVVIVK